MCQRPSPVLLPGCSTTKNIVDMKKASLPSQASRGFYVSQFIATKRNTIVDIIAALFILLFAYTGISKLITIDGFSFVIGVSQVFDKYFRIVAWTVPVVELVVAAALLFNRTRLAALYASFILMVLFDLYIGYIILYMPNKPCHCGGVISQLDWNEHLIFNFFFTLLAFTGIRLERKNKRA
jgi:hypothetical protein